MASPISVIWAVRWSGDFGNRDYFMQVGVLLYRLLHIAVVEKIIRMVTYNYDDYRYNKAESDESVTFGFIGESYFGSTVRL